MRPTTQTRFGVPDGNCTEAAIASVLEIPLEDVPDLQHIPMTGFEWLKVINDWLTPTHGLVLVCFGMGWGETPSPPAWTLLGGTGPRGHPHMTVGFGGEIQHDPHPERLGLVEIDLIGMFVAVDAATTRSSL